MASVRRAAPPGLYWSLPTGIQRVSLVKNLVWRPHPQRQRASHLDLPDCPDPEQRLNVHLPGGALPKNVLWQVSGSVELGTTSHLERIVLCQTMISLRTGDSIAGRLMAQTAVTLNTSTFTQPAA